MNAPDPTTQSPAAAVPTRADVIIATRESRLAMWQAEHVQALLRERFGLVVELLGMTTRGDQILDRALSKVGGKGLFVKELETALELGHAHLAVHSLKDVPMDLPAGFELVAVMKREDPRDAFVSPRYASLADLPLGAKVGTSSLRRVVQLRAMRPDLVIDPLRGNLDTRLRKLDDGQYDAIVLAAAGLMRLGLESRIRCRFDIAEMLPCAGQGALGLEIRSDATDSLRQPLASLIDTPTLLAVTAERAVSRALGGSCSMPLAAHAEVLIDGAGQRLSLAAALGHPADAKQPLLKAQITASTTSVAEADALGRSIAQQLRQQGAGPYLDAAAALSAAG